MLIFVAGVFLAGFGLGGMSGSSSPASAQGWLVVGVALLAYQSAAVPFRRMALASLLAAVLVQLGWGLPTGFGDVRFDELLMVLGLMIVYVSALSGVFAAWRVHRSDAKPLARWSITILGLAAALAVPGAFAFFLAGEWVQRAIAVACVGPVAAYLALWLDSRGRSSLEAQAARTAGQVPPVEGQEAFKDTAARALRAPKSRRSAPFATWR